MPTNTFSLGKDCQLVLIAPTGAQVSLSIVTGFDAKQGVHSIRVRPLNGPPQGFDMPDGWTGSFHVERGNSALDDLFSQIEQSFWNGGSIGTGQIYQYVTEVNGSQSVYLFGGVTITLSDAGNWQADSSVKQTVTFFAATRKRV